MKKILMVADGVTMAHVTRMEQLSRQIDRADFEIHFAAPENYFHLLSFDQPFAAPPYKIRSVPTDLFVDRLFKNHFPWKPSELDQQLNEDLELIERVQPDLVIGDTRLSLGVACARTSVPYFNMMNFQWHSNYHRPQFVPHAQVVELFGRKISELVAPAVVPLILNGQLKTINSWLKSVGSNPVKTIYEFYGQGDFLLFPDLMDFFKNYPTPTNSCFIGPLIWKSPKLQWPSEWTTVEKGKAKYAMLSMGSSGATKLSASLIRSLVELDFEVLYSGSKVSLEDTDENKVHHSAFFPMDEVLKVCSLAVGNGGIATTYQFLSVAMPFYSIPNNLDQYLNVNILKNFELSDHQNISNFSAKKFKSQINKLMTSAELPINLSTYQRKIIKTLAKSTVSEFLKVNSAAKKYQAV